MANDNDAKTPETQLPTLYAEMKAAMKSRGRARMTGTLLLLTAFLVGGGLVVNKFYQFDTEKLTGIIQDKYVPMVQKDAQDALELMVKERKERFVSNLKGKAEERLPILRQKAEDELHTIAANFQTTFEERAKAQVTTLFETASEKALVHFPKDQLENDMTLAMVHDVAKDAVEEVFQKDLAVCDRHIKSIEDTIAQARVADEVDEMKKLDMDALEKKFTSLMLTVLSRPVAEKLQQNLPEAKN